MKKTIENEVITITETDRKNYATLVAQVQKHFNTIEKGYLNVAAAVYMLHKKELYKVEGYRNIAEMANDVFGMSKGTTSNLLNIVKQFGNPDNGKLLPEYEGYNFSQLRELMQIPEEQRALVDETAKARDIAELAKSFKEPKKPREGRHATDKPKKEADRKAESSDTEQNTVIAGVVITESEITGVPDEFTFTYKEGMTLSDFIMKYDAFALVFEEATKAGSTIIIKKA